MRAGTRVTKYCRHLLVTCIATLSFLACDYAIAVPAKKKADPEVQARLEKAQARQEDILRLVASELQPQRPGVRDVYFIGIAGWGDQGVFRQEVDAVRALFESSYGARGRSISLVNHPDTLEQMPLANHDTIEAALMAVAETMDVEEDLLVLFITSHGGEWNGVDLVLNGQDFGKLRTPQLAKVLGATRIRNRVVIVSACYSGQFVPALAEENTLLITAAASDRASFGCTADADWTWFGRAFFQDALRKHRKFIPAFEEARKRIESRERKKKFKPSVPQIRAGANIRKVLEEMGL